MKTKPKEAPPGTAPSWRSVHALSFLYYFGTGIHNAYDLAFAWTYLQDHGVSHTSNSVIRSVLYIPYLLKIIFAVTADKYRIWMPGTGSGHRRPYILIGIILNFLGFFLTGYADPRNDLSLYTLLQFLDMTGIVIADTNMDALLIEMTERMDKALIASGDQDSEVASEAQVQGTVGVGMAMGVAAGSVGFGGMQKQKKYQAYFFICAILFATIMLFSLPFSSEPSEEEEDSTRQPFKWEAFSMFCDGEYMGAVWGLFWYTFFGRLSSGIVAQLVAPILEEDTIYGYEKDQTGKIFGMMGFMFLLGCGVAGLLKPKFGATLTGATALLVVGGIMMAMVSDNINLFIVGLLIVLFSGGVINVISAACLMILSEPEINASFFAIAMITQNAGNVVSRFITGPLVDSGRDANGRVILTRDKAVFALYVAVGIGALGILAIPMIWTGINKRMEERQRVAEGGAPDAKQVESGQDDQQGNYPGIPGASDDENYGMQ